MSEKALTFWFTFWVIVKTVNKLLTWAIGIAILLILLGVQGVNWWQVVIMFGGGVTLALIYTLSATCYVFTQKGDSRKEAMEVFNYLFKKVQ